MRFLLPFTFYDPTDLNLHLPAVVTLGDMSWVCVDPVASIPSSVDEAAAISDPDIDVVKSDAGTDVAKSDAELFISGVFDDDDNGKGESKVYKTMKSIKC